MVVSHSWIPSVFPIQTIPYTPLYMENQPTLITIWIGTLATQFQLK